MAAQLAWWQTAPGVHRRSYAFVAFPPDYPGDRVTALAHASVCAAGGWSQYQSPDSGPAVTGQTGLVSWRHAPSGAVLSLFIVAQLPLVAVMAPGDLTTTPVQAMGVGILPGRTARLAVRRFVRQSSGQAGRVILTARLPALIAASIERGVQSAAIRARFAQIAEEERLRSCPRCTAGCAPDTRWCPRCEYEFTHADDHARDLAVMQRRREAEGLRQMLSQLSAQSFPPLNVMGWAGPR
ncbi:MAG TPA: hypothetical protein VGM10_22145 [Actinocrinis sp.]|jgi:hypothetical protein